MPPTFLSPFLLVVEASLFFRARFFFHARFFFRARLFRLEMPHDADSAQKQEQDQGDDKVFDAAPFAGPAATAGERTLIVSEQHGA